MDRYSIIEEKFPREIVLLKGLPCKWGRCSFCDYIEDNSTDISHIDQVNKEVLAQVRGSYSRLEAINSASVFEMTPGTLEAIKDLAYDKGIKELVFEAHWIYRNRLDEIRKYFPDIKVIFKTGIETFDDDFRNKVLKKGIYYDDISQVSDLFDSACLMVGIQGQTRDMIKKDIDLGLEYFQRLTVNVYNDNSTAIKRDEDLVRYFVQDLYPELKGKERVEVLIENTDFGVG